VALFKWNADGVLIHAAGCSSHHANYVRLREEGFLLPQHLDYMVFFFKARPSVGDIMIYMGLDKYENEDLIKYGLPEDIW
jgi:hypothetical protein